jgi:hypothetical protein
MRAERAVSKTSVVVLLPPTGPRHLAVAYARAADYLAASARQLIDGRSAEDDVHAARAAADVAVRRLDEAFRQYLGERSATRVNLEDVATLVDGASRVRRAGESLTVLARMTDGEGRLDGCGRNLESELQALQTWYMAFGFALITGDALPPAHPPDGQDARQLLSCVRDAARDRGNGTVNAGVALLLASQHLENLSRLETLLSDRADAIRSGDSSRLSPPDERAVRMGCRRADCSRLDHGSSREGSNLASRPARSLARTWRSFLVVCSGGVRCRGSNAASTLGYETCQELLVVHSAFYGRIADEAAFFAQMIEAERLVARLRVKRLYGVLLYKPPGT